MVDQVKFLELLIKEIQRKNLALSSIESSSGVGFSVMSSGDREVMSYPGLGELSVSITFTGYGDKVMAMLRSAE
jgi:hypothetical protein